MTSRHHHGYICKTLDWKVAVDEQEQSTESITDRDRIRSSRQLFTWMAFLTHTCKDYYA